MYKKEVIPQLSFTGHRDLVFSYQNGDGTYVSIHIPKEQVKKAFYLLNEVFQANGIKSWITEGETVPQ